VIETARLTLRPWRDADRDVFVAFATDPAVGDWLGGARSHDEALADFERMRATWDANGAGWLAIAKTDDDGVVGRVCCRRQPPEWAHPMAEVVEVGWALARNAWGHGYASEAAAAILPWGFARFDDPAIYAWTARTNARSQAVMKRIGMTPAPEHDFDHPNLAADHPLRPHVVYAIAR
jgi:RimJ/RimL family protein N-acetyltransferase